MKFYFILLLLILSLITSCREPVNEVRVRQIGLAQLRKGAESYEAGSLDSSLYYLNLSLKYISPKDTAVYGEILFMRSHLYIKFNKPDSAIHDLEQSLTIRLANFNDTMDLAFLYGETKRFKDGLAILEKVKNIDSSNPVIYNGMAHYSGEAGMYGKAIMYAEEGLSMTHDSALIGALLNNLGYAQVKVVSDSVGLKTVEHSIHVSPQNPFTYYNIGRIYHDKGEKEKEVLYFRKADSLGGIKNCSQGQIKICQNFIRAELEATYSGKLNKPGKPGRLAIVFEERFSDSAIVLLNDKIIFRNRLKSSTEGVCNEELKINYSHYKELPRITVILIDTGESMFFYPARDQQRAYINHIDFNHWNVKLSNNSHFYF